MLRSRSVWSALLVTMLTGSPAVVVLLLSPFARVVELVGPWVSITVVGTSVGGGQTSSSVSGISRAYPPPRLGLITAVIYPLVWFSTMYTAPFHFTACPEVS